MIQLFKRNSFFYKNVSFIHSTKHAVCIYIVWYKKNKKQQKNNLKTKNIYKNLKYI
jgi:hypothetical protein